MLFCICVTRLWHISCHHSSSRGAGLHSSLFSHSNIVSAVTRRSKHKPHTLERQTTMRAHDRGLVAVVVSILLFTNELCNSFVLRAPSSSRLPSETWVNTSPFTAPRIIRDDTNNKFMQRNHVLTNYHYNIGAPSYTLLREQEGQSNLQS